jgi:hypothetical protein
MPAPHAFYSKMLAERTASRNVFVLFLHTRNNKYPFGNQMAPEIGKAVCGGSPV